MSEHAIRRDGGATRAGPERPGPQGQERVW
jgi:hypothetical protein